MKPSSFVLTAAALLSLALAVTPAAAVADSKFKILHNFTDGTDGGNPIIFAALAIDNTGNLYGATYYGGTGCGGEGCGVVFQMSRSAGHWNERVLFDATDPRTQGYFDSPLIVDSEVDLYGCAADGPMFELMPGAPQWTYNPIWPSGCAGPVGLTFDGASNI